MVEFVILTSLGCLAIHVSINWPRFVLNWALKYLERIPFDFIKKPLFACLPCMGSFWSIVHWVVGGGRLEGLDVLAILILAVVGLNTLFELFIRMIEAIENLETFE